MTDKKGELSGSYQYTLSENTIMISNGQNALAYAVYDGDEMVAMLKGVKFDATDEISYGLENLFFVHTVKTEPQWLCPDYTRR